MDIQHGYWRWKLFRWNDHPNPFRNRPTEALSWLRQYAKDPNTLAELAQLLRANSALYPNNTTPDAFLQEVADQMSSGEIMACVELIGEVDETADFEVANSEPDLTEMASQAASPAPAPPPPDTPPSDTPDQESTLSGNADPAGTAEALKEAAKNGSPFCEECAKAAAAAPPPVDPDTDVDPETAEVLKLAAVRGTPFCVECEKARRRQQQAEEEYDVDPATAQVLKDAAVEGAPFCEECERAKRKQAQQKSQSKGVQ